MPKDEFDFEDPLELNGVAFLTEEDTSAEMTQCFAEEFLRLGYGPDQVLALFANPHYTGPHMVMMNKGEAFVRGMIAETFARWGKRVDWAPGVASHPPSPVHRSTDLSPASAGSDLDSGALRPAPHGHPPTET